MAESLSPFLSCSLSHSHSLSLHNLLDIDALLCHFPGVSFLHGYELHGLESCLQTSTRMILTCAVCVCVTKREGERERVSERERWREGGSKGAREGSREGGGGWEGWMEGAREQEREVGREGGTDGGREGGKMMERETERKRCHFNTLWE